MKRGCSILIFLTVVLPLFFTGYLTPTAVIGDEGALYKSFKDYHYPDYYFKPKEYIRGMKKVGHNLLLWQESSADLSKYKSVRIIPFKGDLLPIQEKFSYEPFIEKFNQDFKDSFQVPTSDRKGLRVEGAIVECKLGSGGLNLTGKGRIAYSVACEIFEPGSSKPIIRIYARDTGSLSLRNSDPILVLNYICSVIAKRVSAKIEEKIGM